MLRAKAKAALLWAGLNILANRGAGFVITIVLARLLTPEDFGTIALLSVFVGVANVFVNAGLGFGLIQRQNVSHIDESTVFWFNLAVALLMAGLLVLSAPWIASYFGVAVLAPLTLVMAMNLLVSALGSIQGALMTRRLDFKTPMIIGVASTLTAGCTGIYMAWAGYGVWALAIQALLGSVTNTALTWIVLRWRPLARFSVESFLGLFSFSGWLFLSWLLDALYQRAYTVMLGKTYGAHDLGVYTRADSTQQLASGVLTDVLSRVAFPLFSSVNADKDRLRRGTRMAARAATLVTAPAMMGLAVLAHPFISAVFGERWLPAVPILQVLCIVGLLYPLHVINLSVLQAQGHANLFFRLELAKKGVGTLLLVVGSFYGVLGMAWSRVLASVFALVINTYYTRKFLAYGVGEQVRDCTPSLLIAAIMAVLVHLTQGQVGSSVLAQLTFSVLLGTASYVLLNVLVRATPFTESLNLLIGREREN